MLSNPDVMLHLHACPVHDGSGSASQLMDAKGERVAMSMAQWLREDGMVGDGACNVRVDALTSAACHPAMCKQHMQLHIAEVGSNMDVIVRCNFRLIIARGATTSAALLAAADSYHRGGMDDVTCELLRHGGGRAFVSRGSSPCLITTYCHPLCHCLWLRSPRSLREAINLELVQRVFQRLTPGLPELRYSYAAWLASEHASAGGSRAVRAVPCRAHVHICFHYSYHMPPHCGRGT